MRKISLESRATEWTEPTRIGGPDMNAKAAAEELEFKDIESIHILVRRGPCFDGLPGYIPGPGGRGWRLKTGAEHAGVEVMFYSSDITTWKEKHPIVPPGQRYGPEATEQVFNEMDAAGQTEEGIVNTSRLYEILRAKYPDQWASKGLFRDDAINRIEKILMRAEIKISTEEESRHILEEAEKIRTPDARVTRKALLSNLGEKYGVKKWNSRAYNKIKQVLDANQVAPAVERDNPRHQYKV